MKSLLILTLLFAPTLVHRPSATRSEETLDTEQIDMMVTQHNVWRDKVGCPPVTWSPDLAKYAQQWADQLAKRGCEMKHRPPDKYGENIFWSSGLNNKSDYVVD